jgi:hypothetical protein
VTYAYGSSSGTSTHTVGKAPVTITVTLDAGATSGVFTGDCLPHGATAKADTNASVVSPYSFSNKALTVYYSGTQSGGAYYPGPLATSTTTNKPTASGNYTATATYASPDYPGDAANYIADPASVSVPFSISNTAGSSSTSGALYTGSLFFWTTGPSSGTASLALSCTIKDIGDCPGNITGATVTFQASTDGGVTFTNISNAVNRPVGLVNPGDPTVGTASALSQWNISSNKDVEQLYIRIVVGGSYLLKPTLVLNKAPVTVAKPGLASQFIGNASVSNGVVAGGYPQSNGYLGSGATDASTITTVQANVQYNKSYTNPQGKVIVTFSTYNKSNGDADTVLHNYVAISNAISELTQLPQKSGEPLYSFSSKVTLKEILPNGSTISLDSGNMLNVTLRQATAAIPATQTTPLVPAQPAKMSVQIQKSAGQGGGLWFASSWGPASGGGVPQPLLKPTASGDVLVY